jgi:hypothetical protein
VIVAALGLLGLALYRLWFSDIPLTAGDWTYVSPGTIHEWFPWPPIWNNSIGFGSKQFYGAFEFPMQAVAGFLAVLGVPWSLIEKILYFWLFALLLPIGAWYLGYELLGSRAWALLSAALYATSTYFLTFIVRGDLYIGLAQAIAPLVLVSFTRAIRNPSLRRTICAGAALAVESTFEVRVAYLTVGMCLLYLAVSVIAEPIGRTIVRRLTAAAGSLGILAALQSYWILPFLTYRGDYGLPIPSSPWLAFMRITHAMTGLSPVWTGGAPATFRTEPVPPEYFIVPALAFLLLLGRRVRPEYLWLSLSALIAAFLIKQTNPPAGQTYDWLFHHLPGFNLFREASKLYFIVAISYAILIPAGLRRASVLASRVASTRLQWLLRSFVPAALVWLTALTMSAILPMESGALGFTTRPLVMPSAFVNLSQLIDRDPEFGRVLWLGGAYVNRPNENFRGDTFYITSVVHPLVELYGLRETKDPLVQFCSTEAPYCYVSQSLFPFLIARTAATYVVAPAGSAVGYLPLTDYRTLLRQLSEILGQPQLMGDGDYALAVWKLAQPRHLVTESQAVAVVRGPTEATIQALPAINALDLPVIYEAGAGSSAQLPLAIPIELGINGDYVIDDASDFVVFAQTAGPQLTVVEGNQGRILPRVLRGKDGWNGFGPIFLNAGTHHIGTNAPSLVGPLVAWTSLVANLLTPATQDPTLNQPERFGVQVVGDRRWVEVGSTYDDGWQGKAVVYHAVGDGLFNLFLVSDSSRYVEFTFATRQWEFVGGAMTFGFAALLALAMALTNRRRERRLQRAQLRWHDQGRQRPSSVGPTSLGRLAGYFAAIGVILVVLAGIWDAVAIAQTSSIAHIDQLLTNRAAPGLFAVPEAHLTLAMVSLFLSVGLHLVNLCHLQLTRNPAA